MKRCVQVPVDAQGRPVETVFVPDLPFAELVKQLDGAVVKDRTMLMIWPSNLADYFASVRGGGKLYEVGRVCGNKTNTGRLKEAGFRGLAAPFVVWAASIAHSFRGGLVTAPEERPGHLLWFYREGRPEDYGELTMCSISSNNRISTGRGSGDKEITYAAFREIPQ